MGPRYSIPTTATLVLMIVYKCLNDMAPAYLTQTISLHEPTRSGLRSEDDITRLFVHNTRKMLKLADTSTFSYTVPNIWNLLSKDIRESESTGSRPYVTELKGHCPFELKMNMRIV